MTLINFYYCGHICVIESGTLFKFVYSVHFLFVYQNCSVYILLLFTNGMVRMVWVYMNMMV